jgi:hypothetical protein
VADWVVISSLATAGGTLALAGSTYASVRSANRAARAAEGSLLAALRPLLVESSELDPPLHVGFKDHPAFTVPGGSAVVEVVEGRLYVVLSLRNVGPGIGVLHGGRIDPERFPAQREHVDTDRFRMLSRDIYIPPGKNGFYQIAFRDEQGEERDAMLEAVRAGGFSAEILYGDFEGGQRVITRFNVVREDDGVWRMGTVRHWQIDRPDPR